MAKRKPARDPRTKAELLDDLKRRGELLVITTTRLEERRVERDKALEERNQAREEREKARRERATAQLESFDARAALEFLLSGVARDIGPQDFWKKLRSFARSRGYAGNHCETELLRAYIAVADRLPELALKAVRREEDAQK